MEGKRTHIFEHLSLARRYPDTYVLHEMALYSINSQTLNDFGIVWLGMCSLDENRIYFDLFYLVICSLYCTFDYLLCSVFSNFIWSKAHEAGSRPFLPHVSAC